MTSWAGEPRAGFGASTEAILEHYDAGNSFFEAWLDPSMTYSAAKWTATGPTPHSLEQAQALKLDWHLDAAEVRPGARILDVGCGWGSLLRRSVLERQAAHAVGLTPSRRQCDWIGRNVGEASVETVCAVWQDADLAGRFDAVFSLGAIEHFARPGLGTADKIRAYQRFFEFCRDTIADNGRLSVQFIGWMDVPQDAEAANLPAELFPQSNLPRLAEIIAASEPTFHPMMMENVPRDYSLTIGSWLSNLNRSRDALIAAHGADPVKRYIRAFRRFILGFETGALGLYRMSFRPREFQALRRHSPALEG